MYLLEKKGFMKKQLGLLLGFLCWANIAGAAFPAFKVQDIKLEGIQHVKPGVVFHNFPINTGNVINQQALSAAVKKLYKSGYFQDIASTRDSYILKVAGIIELLHSGTERLRINHIARIDGKID